MVFLTFKSHEDEGCINPDTGANNQKRVDACGSVIKRPNNDNDTTHSSCRCRGLRQINSCSLYITSFMPWDLLFLGFHLMLVFSSHLFFCCYSTTNVSMHWYNLCAYNRGKRFAFSSHLCPFVAPSSHLPLGPKRHVCANDVYG